MAYNCCFDQKQRLDRGFLRSLVLVFMGLLLIIPGLEDILSTGYIGLCYFGVSTYAIFDLIYKDMPGQRVFSFFIVILLNCGLISPLIVSTIFSKAILLVSLIGIVFLLTLSDSVKLSSTKFLARIWIFPFMYMILKSNMLFTSLLLCLSISGTIFFTSFASYNTNTSLMYALAYKFSKVYEDMLNIFKYPRTDQIILVLCLINWSITFCYFIAPVTTIYANMLHDSLLILGIYNFSSYLRDFFRSVIASHNHTETFQTAEGQEIRINSLKRGMKIRLGSMEYPLELPINCKADGACYVIDNSAEKSILMQKGSNISKGTKILSGSIEITEDYIHKKHITDTDGSEAADSTLNAYLLFSLSLSMILSFIVGNRQGIIEGLYTFCSIMSVNCPCVFLISKPIIIRKFSQWLENTNIECLNIPESGPVNKAVFDRTHTLFCPDPKNPGGKYILPSSAMELIEDLYKSGVEIFIISGHGTDQWEENLAYTRRHLSRYVPEKNIDFNRRYHDVTLGAKLELVRNIQLWGALEPPKTIYERVWCRFKNIFNPNVVAMFGDGPNDACALRQADFSGAISYSSGSYNTDVIENANFCLIQKDIRQIGSLLQAWKNTHRSCLFFYGLAFVYNLSMIMLISGLSNYIFGFALSTSLACAISSVACISLSIYASYVEINDEKKWYEWEKRPLQVSPCCADSICNNQHQKAAQSNFAQCCACNDAFNMGGATELSCFRI